MSLKILVFINGNVVTSAQPLVLSKSINSLDVVFDRLTTRLRPNFGAVRRLYTLAGKRVHEFGDLEDNHHYVAAGNTGFKRAQYRGVELSHASTRAQAANHSPTATTILVAKNGESHAPIRIPIPLAATTFEQVLKLMATRISLGQGQVRKLYTSNGHLVTHIDQLKHQELYVAADTDPFKPLSYNMWKGTHSTASLPGSTPATARRNKSKAHIRTTKFDALQEQIQALVQDRKRLRALWRALDLNNNGIVRYVAICILMPAFFALFALVCTLVQSMFGLNAPGPRTPNRSLAEVDKLVLERFPLLNHKPALMRAFKYTTLRDGDGDAWIERKEFPPLLRNIFFFNKLFHIFEQLDSNHDRRIDPVEFRENSHTIGLKLSDAELVAAFAELDVNHGGHILFDEFCSWVARVECPVDGDILEGSTRASATMDIQQHSRTQGSKPRSALADKDIRLVCTQFDEVEPQIQALLHDPEALQAAWRALDYNGNGICSLAEVDKWTSTQFPMLDHKPALMRAFKQTTLVDGDQDAWVEKAEFPALIRNIFTFNLLFHIFDHIDRDDDRRINFEEFQQGVETVGASLSSKQAAREFENMDSNDGGVVLFDEFCAWVARNKYPVNSIVLSDFTMASTEMEKQAATAQKQATQSRDVVPDIVTRRFDLVEKDIKSLVADAARLRRAWNQMDYNGNGKVSLAEIDKFVVERYPVLNHKPALMRAYKKTTIKDGDGDPWIEKHEFVALLINIVYFVKVFCVFADLDRGADRRLNFAEFYSGLDHLGMHMDKEEARDVFARIDTNKGGQILFDEFCAWLARESVPVDDQVVTAFTTAA